MAGFNFDPTMANREVANFMMVPYSKYVMGDMTPFMYIDYANATTNEVTGDRVYAYGGMGHPRKVAFDGDRASTLMVSTQIFSMKMFAMQAGQDVQLESTNLFKTDKLIATTSKVVLTEVPVEGSISIYTYGHNCEEAYEFDAVKDDTDVTGKTFTVTQITPDGAAVVADGVYAVNYMKTLTTGKAQSVTIRSDKFPQAYYVEAMTYFKTTNDELLPFYIKAYKAVPQTGFTLNFSNTGDPTSLDITFDLLETDEGDTLTYVLVNEDA